MSLLGGGSADHTEASTHLEQDTECFSSFFSQVLRATSPALSHRPRVAFVSVGDGDHTDACTPLEQDTLCFSASPGL